MIELYIDNFVELNEDPNSDSDLNDDEIKNDIEFGEDNSINSGLKIIQSDSKRKDEEKPFNVTNEFKKKRKVKLYSYISQIYDFKDSKKK